MGLVVVSRAVDISMIDGNSGGTSSYNSGIDWSNGLPPGPGTNYFTNGQLMRSPDGDSSSDNHVFAGDSLTLNGGTFAWKSAGVCTVTNFIIDSGSIQHWRDHALARLYGNITINPGKTLTFISPGANARRFDIYSTIHGSSYINARMDITADGTEKRVSFLADNSATFTGKVLGYGTGYIGFTNENALGSNPVAFTDDQLSLRGTKIKVINSLEINDPNRGIKLMRDGSDPDWFGGGFEVSDGCVATVSCVISGDEPLTKSGDGTLVLATNETYTGETIVEEGVLLLSSNATLSSSAVVLQGGSFGGVIDGCSVSDLVFDGGGISVDPIADDPATPRVTVTGSISNTAFNPIIVNVQNLDTVQQDFKILDSADLADVAPHDLCVNPPWAGFLEIQDNGSGGKVLVLTTMPSTNVQYQTWSDDYGHSAMLETNWTDHLAPSAGKIYVNNSQNMRSPQSGSHTFAGDRLVFDGRGLAMKGSGMPTVNDLVAMNQASMSLAEPPIGKISGDITLYPILSSGSSYALSLYGWTPLRTFHMYANLHGYGELRMFSHGDPAYGNAAFPLYAKNTNFFGRVRLDGNTNFSVRVSCEENLGGEPPAFRVDQLTFNGGGISVVTNVVIDDANRGITLMDDGGYSGMSSDEGSFTNGTPAAERRFEGGAVFSADAGHTLSIGCPITGPGDVLKLGEGRVVLSGSNSYTNGTTIAQGGLAGASASAFGSGPVRVEGEGRLLALYSESMPENGVELGNTLEFVNGGAVSVGIAEGTAQPVGSFTVPVCLLAEGETINAEDVPLDTDLSGVQEEVVTSTVGSRVLISVQFTSNTGTTLLLR